jgi:hypothetical protein
MPDIYRGLNIGKYPHPPTPAGGNISQCHWGKKYQKGENVKEKEERGKKKEERGKKMRKGRVKG